MYITSNILYKFPFRDSEYIKRIWILFEGKIGGNWSVTKVKFFAYTNSFWNRKTSIMHLVSIDVHFMKLQKPFLRDNVVENARSQSLI